MRADDEGQHVESARRGEPERKDLLGIVSEPGLELTSSVMAANRPAEQSATEPAAPLGTLGQYELLEPLGRGGMGTVYRARHVRLGKIVAIKVVGGNRLTSRVAIARFEREMQAVGQLDHPNIVRATDGGEASGTHFLVLEFVDGVEIGHLLRRVGSLAIADACELARQTAIGLQYAHEQGLVHRDIKPSNLMIAADGTVKVLDLGLALLQASLSPPGEELTDLQSTVGTIEYMSPEQSTDSHAVDSRTDIYSLGVTLYKLLAGEAPFAHYTTPAEKLAAIIHEPPALLTMRRPEVPEPLARLIHQMLAKKREDRPATARDVATALAQWTAGAKLTALLDTSRRDEETDKACSHFTQGSLAPTRDFVPGDKFCPTVELVTPPARDGRGRGRWPKLALEIGGLLAASVAAVIVYRVQTQQGTLVVKADDRQVAVKLAGGGLQIEDEKTGRKYSLRPGEQRLPLGPYRIAISDESGLQFNTDHFEIRRDGQAIVEVTLEKGPAVASINPIANKPAAVQPKAVSKPAVPEAAAMPDGQVRQFSVERPQAVLFAQHELALVATSWSKTVSVWNLATHDAPKTYATANHYLNGVAISADGRWLLACTRDGVVTLWNTATGAAFLAEEQHVTTTSIAISLDGRWVVSSGSDPGLRLWSLENGKLEPRAALTGHDGMVNDVAFSQRGDRIVSAGRDRTIRIWSAPDAEEISRLTGHDNQVLGVAISTDGLRVASAGMDKTVRLWDVADQRLLSVGTGHTEPVKAVAISPDGRYLASGGDDMSVRVWNLDGTEVQRFLGHTGSVTGVAFAPDGHRIASCAMDNTARLWAFEPPAVVKKE